MNDRPARNDAPDGDGPGDSHHAGDEEITAYEDSDDIAEHQLDELTEKLAAEIRKVVRIRPGIEVDELVEILANVLTGAADAGSDDADDIGWDADFDSDVDLHGLIIDLLYAETNVLCEQHGPLIETADGKLLDLAHMVTDKVFTHRVSAIEAEADMLVCEFDLWPLSGFETLGLDTQSVGASASGITHADGDDLIDIFDDPYAQRWSHPGWEDAFAEGSTVAIRIDEDARARITVLDEDPPLDPQILESFRGAYELHRESTDLPPTSDLLAAEMLLDEPSIFDEPTAPLSQYAAGLGLEIRGSLGADESAQWSILASAERETRLLGEFGDAISVPALQVLRTADRMVVGDPLVAGLTAGSDQTGGDPTGTDRIGSDPPGGDREAMHEAIASLTDPHIRDVVSNELFVMRGNFLPSIDARPFLDAGVESAQSDSELATIHFMRHRMAIHDDDLTTAEAELRRAVEADPDFAEAVHQLAWFASLRGDAAAAVELWQRLESDDETRDNLAIVAPLTAAGHKPGRNAPCWCGSGRKYKKCHLGVLPVPELAERVQWLWHKGVTAPEITTTERSDHTFDVALARSSDLSDMGSFEDDLDDPLTHDLVLTEGGFWIDFLEIFGSLLPEDERQLSQTWTDVQRSVYEITAMSAGTSATLTDVRTGEASEVPLSTQAPLPATSGAGTLVCARLVPDSTAPQAAGPQIVGDTFAVPAGSEETVLGILDAARAEMSGLPIAEWLSTNGTGRHKD